MAPFLNIAAYRFVPLPDPAALGAALRDAAQAQRLRGTLLLAPEGLNVVLAGPPAGVRAWLAALRADPRFAGLPVRQSGSQTLPFQRLRLKIKAEIIRMDQPAIRPAAGRAPAVAPATLARWLAQGGRDDAGRPVAVLDTRNAFEVDAGRFTGSIDWRLARFGDFPAAFATHRAALDGHTVVSVCTGGIRCEKAALWMRSQGLADVLQLDGGILQYFDDTGGRAPGWEGDCVVFDARRALDTALAPAAAAA